jgi:hypothetical protein
MLKDKATSSGITVIKRLRAMTPLRHQFSRLLIGTMVAIVSAGAVACAQDDWEREEKVEASGQEDLQKFRVEQQRQRLQMAYKAQFDHWLASQFRPLGRARDLLEMRLAGRLRELEAECHLTAAQVKKLQLAGRGDIKRFMDRVDHIARVMEEPGSSVEDLRAARLEMIDLGTLAGPRLFGDDSLLCKTLGSTLDQDQAAARERALLERNAVRHRTTIDRVVKALQNNLGMNEEQESRLAELLLRETRPPRKFGNAPDVALVLFQASRIPEARIGPIFDDAQWRIMSRWMAIYVRGASGEGTLNRNGFVFDDDASVTPPDHIKPLSNKHESRKAEQSHRD